MPRVKKVKSLHETASELNKTMKKRRQAGMVDAPRTFSEMDTKTGKKTTVTVGGNLMGPSTAKKKKKAKGK